MATLMDTYLCKYGNSYYSFYMFGKKSEYVDIFVNENKFKRVADGYAIFDTETKLWNCIDDDIIGNLFRNYIKELRWCARNNEMDKDLKKYSMKDYRKRSALTSSKEYIKSCITKHIIKNIEDITEKINMNKSVLPIKNGKIIDLSTKHIRDRTELDYFTVELPIEYLENHDTSNINKYYSTNYGKSDIQKIMSNILFSLPEEDKLIYVFYNRNMEHLLNIIKEMLTSVFCETIEQSIIDTKCNNNCNTAARVTLCPNARFNNEDDFETIDDLDEEQCRNILKYSSLIICADKIPNITNEYIKNTLCIIDISSDTNHNDLQIELSEFFTWCANGICK